MKQLVFLFCLFTATIGITQTFPIDFESSITTNDFIDFDGGMATVITNPFIEGINTSNTVAQIIRNTGAVWAGSKIEMADNVDFSNFNSFSMKVFTTAPIGTIVKLKFEGLSGSIERDAILGINNSWTTLYWDLTGTTGDFNEIVFMFDFGNVGDGSVNSTFLFDDIEQYDSGNQLDLPVDFDDSDFNYKMTDFGGAFSSLAPDTINIGNMVMGVIKSDQAATWAGTTIGTNAGFVNFIPLTLTDSKMNIRILSPDAGIPIRLKVEDANDPTHTCETEAFTTVAGEWETLEFDFTNEAMGTQSLSIGLGMGWKYNMASIFFNFGTEGSVAGEKLYFFDNVRFGEPVSSTLEEVENELVVFPNPTNDHWNFQSTHSTIEQIEIFNFHGQSVLRQNPKKLQTLISCVAFAKGIYIAKINTNNGSKTMRLVKN